MERFNSHIALMWMVAGVDEISGEKCKAKRFIHDMSADLHQAVSPIQRPFSLYDWRSNPVRLWDGVLVAPVLSFR